MIDVRSNCLRVIERLHQAAARSGRDPRSIKLVAVTKTVAPDRIRQAAECGIHNIGENRLQEALPKKDTLGDLPLTWHFIGHLQTNKARKAVENFDWIQSVDRSELAAKLNQAASKPLPVLIEVKLGDEPTKSGVDQASLSGLIAEFGSYPRLSLRGFMTIPPYCDSADDVRPYFRKLRELAEQFRLEELSMGMSHDFEVAIDEGATMIRVGTALFGER
jgi:PLP dependent protein